MYEDDNIEIVSQISSHNLLSESKHFKEFIQKTKSLSPEEKAKYLESDSVSLRQESNLHIAQMCNSKIYASLNNKNLMHLSID